MSTKTTDLLKLSKKHPNKRAFITGAGNGLGLAFATELAKSGWNIAITDVDSDTLAKAAKSIQSTCNTPISTYNFDVSDYGAFNHAVCDFQEKNGGIDIGINNAGVGCGGFLDEVPIEIFRRVIDINLMGVVNGCHIFSGMMRKQGSGHILNVASAAAFFSAPRMSAYNTSKAGVLALSETLSSELLPDGVSVSVLLPSFVRTSIGENCLGSSADKILAQSMVQESQVTAEEVVIETFAKMEAGCLYVVLPEKARFLWRFKRFFPEKFARFVNRELQKRIAKLDLGAP